MFFSLSQYSNGWVNLNRSIRDCEEVGKFGEVHPNHA